MICGLLAAFNVPDCVNGVMGVASSNVCHRARNAPGPGLECTSGVDDSLMPLLVSEGVADCVVVALLVLRSNGGAGLDGRELGREADVEKILAMAGFFVGGDLSTLLRRVDDCSCM